MTSPNRISAKAARSRVTSGRSLLVCIYDDEKFQRQAHLEGAIPMSRFLEMAPGPDTDIIFY